MRVIGGAARGVPLKGPPGPATRATSDKVRGAIFDVLAPIIVDARVLDLYAGTGALGVEALSRGAAWCLFVERAAAACRVIDLNLRAARCADRGTVWTLTVEAALDALETAVQHGLLEPPGEPGTADDGADGTAPTRTTERNSAAHAQTTARGVIPGVRTPQRSVATHARTEGRNALARGRSAVRGRLASLDSSAAPPYDVIMLDPPYNDTGIVRIVERLGGSALLAPRSLVVLEHGKHVTVPPEVGRLRLSRAKTYGDTAVTIWQSDDTSVGQPVGGRPGVHR